MAIALVAGLVAGTRVGRGLTHKVERGHGVTPALVNVEEAWQIAYLIEPLENGWLAVFLPPAPTSRCRARPGDESTITRYGRSSTQACPALTETARSSTLSLRSSDVSPRLLDRAG